MILARVGARRLVLIVGAVLVVAGVSVAARSWLSEGPSRGPKPELRVDHRSPVQAAIDAKCRTGGVVTLSGTYRTPGTVLIEGCRELTLRGPATFDGSNPDRARSDRHVSIRLSSDIVVEDVNVVGTRCRQPRCEGDDVLTFNERQHAFEIAASQRVELRRVTATDVWGDGVYVTAKTFRGTPERMPRDVVVRDSYIQNTGRQGIAASAVDGLLVERTVVREAGRFVLSFEAESGGAANVTVRDSHVVDPETGSLLVTCDTGPGGSLLNRGPFVLAGNRFYGDSLAVNPHACPLAPGLLVLAGNAESLPLGDAPPPLSPGAGG